MGNSIHKDYDERWCHLHCEKEQAVRGVEKVFYEWYEEMFVNAQGEDSPYSFEDVKTAFLAGWKKRKEYDCEI